MKSSSVLAWTVLSTLVLWGTTARAATPTLEEVWEVVQRQQQEINALKTSLETSGQQLYDANARLNAAELELNNSQRQLANQSAQLDATADMIDSGVLNSGSSERVSIGGYGELHYNNLDNGDQIDFHRFVLFFGHQFRDNLSFYSEFELEHSLAGNGGPGEVELEQAFVQWDYKPGQSAKAGVFLIPVGILNETHEPDTFYGVERNNIESQIVPATWWEAGFALNGELAPGWGYDLAVHSGLNLDTANASASKRSSIRSARQKVAKANGDSLAYTARLSYSGIPGLTLATSLQYQADLTQGDDENIGISKVDGTLFETHMSLTKGMFGFRALYARWDLDDQIELLNAGAQEQFGWYLEPSVRLNKNIGLFARYGQYDLTAGRTSTQNEKSQIDLGINYWLHDNVVIKADFRRQDNDNGGEVDGFNIGVGYSF